MIGYLEGKLLKKEEDRILLLVNHVGYEVLLPSIVRKAIDNKGIGDEISLYIHYHVTERQPKPALIGFMLEDEKEFFQYFISVEDIGPMKALQALTLPVSDIASAIESRDLAYLKQLKGIGSRTAQKILATLEGKVAKFASSRDIQDSTTRHTCGEDVRKQVLDVMITQLGHAPRDARHMIDAALKRNSDISSAEDLFDEVYRGETT